MTSRAADYRFLRRPRWLAFTAVVLGLVVLMLNLALWQLRRLDERRDRNDRIAAALEADPVAVDAPAALTEWRVTTARGTFDASREVLIRNRSFQGQPGYHVVTPLVLADGTALLVNRGWLPLAGDDGEVEVPAPPPGDLTITGRVRTSQSRGRFFSPTDPSDGTLAELYRVDVPRITQQVPYPVLPSYVELLGVDPPPDPAAPQPALIPPPGQDDGPHLSYAGQWVLFAACAVAAWIIVIRRRARAAPATVTP